MIANYEKYGFEITAEMLPEACTACPFYGYNVETDTAICDITLNNIRTDGLQDEERERDCPIKKKTIGKWVPIGLNERPQQPDSECSECGYITDYFGLTNQARRLEEMTNPLFVPGSSAGAAYLRGGNYGYREHYGYRGTMDTERIDDESESN